MTAQCSERLNDPADRLKSLRCMSGFDTEFDGEGFIFTA
ncbi:hypothetical protein SP19_157 [Salmonella phage 19]|nr:hypothetical protein SP19_157 [Salmonella phage 19]